MHLLHYPTDPPTLNMNMHNSPRTQFWHAQLQPDMVANQQQDEAGAGNFK